MHKRLTCGFSCDVRHAAGSIAESPGRADQRVPAGSTHLRELAAADPAGTTAALAAAWYGFSLALALGQFLASRSPDLAVLHENATSAWALVVSALDAAPPCTAACTG